MPDKVILQTEFEGLGPVKRGKVRDIYDLGEELLIVATDRVSAFDVVLANGIPDKGRILTGMSAFWFRRLETITGHHLISTDVKDFPAVCRPYADVLEGRSMLVRKAEPLPVECIVRGYLSGSGWKEYSATGKACGIELPAGLMESDQLPKPIFTPSTKAKQGEHDINITFDIMQDMIGSTIAYTVKTISLLAYKEAREFALSKGIIIADTKLEFGLIDGNVVLIDEAFTPDSSRFWPLDEYAPGRPQNSLDKQYIRDYLKSTGWNMRGKPPELTPEVISKTGELYRLIFTTLAGGKWTQGL